MNAHPKSQNVSEVETLVVGAGPTGLAAACELRRHGREVHVVDAGAAGSNTSRAAVIHARTLEVLEPLDVTRRLLADGVVVPVFTVHDRTRVLARISFAALPTRYPYTLMLPQCRTEEVLEDRLEELGGTVHRQVRLMGLRQHDHGIVAELTAPDGDPETIRCRYLVGADGLTSAVREFAGISFDGAAYPQSFVLADATLNWPLPPDEVQLFLSPAGLVVVAPLPGGRHRVVATVHDAPEHPDRDDLQALLDQRGPGDTSVGEIMWSSRFRVQHRLARTYRAGNVFLAGDAAHVHSPAGGQGMNLGIRDAVDLGATIAQAARGAEPAVLDGYEERCRSLARDTIRLTDRATRAASLEHRALRRVRDTVLAAALRAPARQQRLASRLAGLKSEVTLTSTSEHQPA